MLFSPFFLTSYKCFFIKSNGKYENTLNGYKVVLRYFGYKVVLWYCEVQKSYNPNVYMQSAFDWKHNFKIPLKSA